MIDRNSIIIIGFAVAFLLASFIDWRSYDFSRFGGQDASLAGSGAYFNDASRGSETTLGAGQVGNGGRRVPGASGTSLDYSEPSTTPGGPSMAKWLHDRWIRRGWLQMSSDGRVEIKFVPACQSSTQSTAGAVVQALNGAQGILNLCQHADGSERPFGGESLPDDVDYMFQGKGSR